MFWTDVENLEIFAGRLFVDYLDAGCSIFLEVDYCEETLMEGHLWREIFLYSAHEVKLLCLRNFDNVDMAYNEEAIKDIFVSFDAF